MTFTKHFEEILECCNQKFHRLRILVNKKFHFHSFTSPTFILQIYKQCVRPIFEYGIVSTITVSETVITKIQRVQNSFIRLALRLLKYVSACLLHEASKLPYVRERLITAGQNHLARMHANPLVEHTINSARTTIAWDKYKTAISDNDYKMQENEVTSLNVHPLTLKVEVRPIHGHVRRSHRTQKKPTRLPIVSQLNKCLKFNCIRGGKNDCILYKITPRNAMNFRHLFSCDTIVVVLYRCHKHPTMDRTMGKPCHYSASPLDNSCIFAVAIASIIKAVTSCSTHKIDQQETDGKNSKIRQSRS